MIKGLSVRNFKGIADKTVDFNRKLTVFTGESGTGKTSMLSALKYALCGKGTVSDIKNGKIEAEVSLEFDDGTTVERKRDKTGNKVSIAGNNTTAKSAEDYLGKKIADPEILKLMLDTDYFEGLDKKDVTSLFLGIIPAKLDKDSVLKLCEEHTGRSLTDKEKKLIEGELTGQGTFGIDTLNTVHDRLVEERKAVKRDIKNLTEKTKDVIDKPSESADALNDELYKLIEKETVLRGYENELNRYNRELRAYEEAQREIAELTPQLEALKDVTKPDEAALKTLEGDKAKFKEALKQSQATQATLKANIDIFTRTIESLNKPVCPISEKLVCRTDKSGVKADIEDLIRQNKEAYDKHVAFAARCEEQIAKRDAGIDEYRKSETRYERKMMVQKMLEDKKKVTKPEEVKKPEVPADIAEKKAEIRKKLDNISRYDAYEKDVQSLKKCKEELGVIEECVKMFDVKKGIYHLILDRIITPLSQMVNEKAKTYRDGFSVKFDIEEGIEILYEPGAGRGYIPMSNASASEFLFIAYLVITVIGKLTGCRIIVIDNLDKFDGKKAAEFFKLMRDDDTFEQIFAATVNHEDVISTLDKNELVVM